MGYYRVPSWKPFWHNDPDLSVPFIVDVLHRNRFLKILSYIHKNDNSAIPDDNRDKLYKQCFTPSKY